MVDEIQKLTPAIDPSKLDMAKPVERTKPPEPELKLETEESSVNREYKELAETSLPGSKPQENLSNEDIKSVVGEIATDLDRNNAWQEVTNSFQQRLAQQTIEDDKLALNDPVNVEWSLNTGAEIAQFAAVG